MGLLGAPRMQVFPLRCPRCREPMRLIAFVTDSGSTCILGYLGEPAQAPHITPAARGPLPGRRTPIRAKAIRSP